MVNSMKKKKSSIYGDGNGGVDNGDFNTKSNLQPLNIRILIIYKIYSVG